jgi:hypothetical protein
MKQQLHKELKMKKNAAEQAGWWKQNYAYNIPLPDPVQNKPRT